MGIKLYQFRHPSLSDKLKATRILPRLDFKLDPSNSLELLLDAAMPGNNYEFLSVVGMTISMSNSDAVRVKAKHHPNVRFIDCDI